MNSLLMVSGRLRRSQLYTILGCILIGSGLALYYIFGPTDIVIMMLCGGLLWKIFLSLKWWKSPATPPFWLLSVTSIPLLAFVYFDVSPVMSTNLRSFFLNDHYARIALVIVLLQSLSLALFVPYTTPLNLTTLRPEGSISGGRRIVIACVIIGLSILSNPSDSIFLGGYGSKDFFRQSVLIGGWSLFFVVAFSYFVVCTGLKLVSDRVFVVLIVGYWLLHGNRSEVFTTIWLIAVVTIVGRVRLTGRVGIISLGILGLMVFQLVGVIRGAGDDLDYVLADLLGGNWRNLLSGESGVAGLSTPSAVSYSLISTVGLMDSGGLELRYGGSFIDYLYRTFPAQWGIPEVRPDDLSVILIERAGALGGAHFGAEPYWNLGVAGAVIFAFIYGNFVRLVSRRQGTSVLWCVISVSLVLLSARVVWYGNIYLYKMLLLFSFLIIGAKINSRVVAGRSS